MKLRPPQGEDGTSMIKESYTKSAASVNRTMLKERHNCSDSFGQTAIMKYGSRQPVP